MPETKVLEATIALSDNSRTPAAEASFVTKVVVAAFLLFEPSFTTPAGKIISYVPCLFAWSAIVNTKFSPDTVTAAVCKIPSGSLTDTLATEAVVTASVNGTVITVALPNAAIVFKLADLTAGTLASFDKVTEPVEVVPTKLAVSLNAETS